MEQGENRKHIKCCVNRLGSSRHKLGDKKRSKEHHDDKAERIVDEYHCVSETDDQPVRVNRHSTGNTGYKYNN